MGLADFRKPVTKFRVRRWGHQSRWSYWQEVKQEYVEVSGGFRIDGRFYASVIYQIQLSQRLTPISAVRSEAAKERALHRVDDAADEDWKEVALEAVRQVALRRDRFVSDDVWKRLPPTRENRALGPVLRRAAAEGWIIATGEFSLTEQVKRHRAPVRIWQSLICR